jgi:hypothetical protein
MKRLGIIIFSLFVLISCKSTEKKNTRQFLPEPSWIGSTPTNPNYYIGIFGSPKTTSDFRSAAKKGALDNLSSEISVTISGESVLHSLEKNGVFDQEFKQNIKISTQKNLEGYELVSTWEGQTEYWVYYRLSKAEYARLIKEKLDAALNNAKDQFRRAKIKYTESDYSQAFKLCVQSLESVSTYLDKPLITQFEGKEVHFATEVMSFVQGISDELTIIPSFKSKTFKLGDELSGREIFVSITGKSKKVINGIPVKSEYKALLSKKLRTKTDITGKAKLDFGIINQSNKSQTITTKIDFVRMAEESTKMRIVLALLKHLPNKEAKVSLTVNPPKVFIVSKEQELGKKIKSKLTDVVKQSLISKGFGISNSKRNADLILVITGNTVASGQARGAYVVFFKGNIEVYKKSDNSLVFSEVIKEEKGMQLDAKRASDDAYNKANNFVKRRIIPKLSNQYFSF